MTRRCRVYLLLAGSSYLLEATISLFPNSRVKAATAEDAEGAED